MTMAGYPTDLRYTDEHLWVRAREKLVTVGITEHAAAGLGAVGFVELPYAGELFRPGARFARVSGESGSRALLMPFVGQINAANQALDGAAGVVGSDPYGEGWIARIEPADPGAVDTLMDAAAYEAFVAAQGD